MKEEQIELRGEDFLHTIFETGQTLTHLCRLYIGWFYKSPRHGAVHEILDLYGLSKIYTMKIKDQ